MSLVEVLLSCASKCSLGLLRVRGVSVRGLVLPPAGAPPGGNLDNANDLRNV